MTWFIRGKVQFGLGALAFIWIFSCQMLMQASQHRSCPSSPVCCQGPELQRMGEENLESPRLNRVVDELVEAGGLHHYLSLGRAEAVQEGADMVDVRQEPRAGYDLPVLVLHACLGVLFMYVQSYVVHGSPALGNSPIARTGGKPHLACYHQSQHIRRFQMPTRKDNGQVHEMNEFHGPPKMLLWEITGRCNIHCKHCYIGSWDWNREFDKRIIEKGIRDFAEWGVNRIVISGGEPFMHPYLVDICKTAKSYRLETIIATNGTLVTSKLANLLARNEIDFIQVSLDGAENVHDLQRETGSFQASMRGIELLIEAGIPVTTRCTLSSININTIDELLCICSELGLHIDIGLTKKTGCASDSIALDPNDYFSFIDSMKTSQYRDLIVSSQSCHPISEYIKQSKLHRRCIAGTNMVAVSISNHFLPCPYMSSIDRIEDRNNVIQFPSFSADFKNTWQSHELFNTFRNCECKDCVLNSIILFQDSDKQDPFGVESFVRRNASL